MIYLHNVDQTMQITECAHLLFPLWGWSGGSEI